MFILKEGHQPGVYVPLRALFLVCPFFFLSIKFSHHISSASMSAKVFKFFIHDEDNQMYYCKQNQGAEIYNCLLFLFFPFSISNSNLIYMEIFV